MSIRTTAAALALLAAAGLTLTACDSGPPSAPHRTPSATSSSSTDADPALLSATWVPKLKALSDGTGVADCSNDSGSVECIEALTDSVSLFDQIANAVNAADVESEYPKTIMEINKLVNAADAYTKDECAGDPHADVDGSPCPKNALAVTVGVSTLQIIMQTDEANAGIV